MYPECTTMWYTRGSEFKLKYKTNGKIETIEPPFKPYFFVEESKRRVATYHLRRMKIIAHSEPTDLRAIDTGNKVAKISVNLPKFVKMAREVLSIKDIKCYEADIPFERRVRIDLNWKTASSYKIGFFDIECWDAEKDFIRGYDKDQIMCIVVVDNNGKEYILFDKDEYSLLKSFNKLAKQFDMLVGWNSDNFDVPMIREREKMYNLRFPRKEVRWLDLMWVIRGLSIREKPSWSLDFVTQDMLDEKILVHHDKRIHELEDEQIIERCLYDALALKLLNDEYKYVETMIQIAHKSYIFPDELCEAKEGFVGDKKGLKISRAIDALLLRRARELGYVLPSKPEKPHDKRHSGAFIAQPPEAFKLYRSVLVMDFQSLYPNIILAFKVSPDKDGVLYPSIISHLLEERLKYKKLAKETGKEEYDIRQKALKILLNAFYGVMNNPWFRIQRVDLGDFVATKGREIIQSLIEEMKKLGFKVIYGDTDSIFVILSDNLTEDMIFAIEKEVNDLFQSKYGKNFQLEADKLFSALYFPKRASDDTASKKKYAGYKIWERGKGFIEPELEIVGFEAIKGDTPEAAKTLQKELIRMFLSGKSINEIKAFVEEYKRSFLSGAVPVDQLVIWKTLSKEISEYKSTPPHVTAAKIMREHGYQVYVKDKIPYFWSKKGALPYIKECLDESVDYKYYWEHVFEPIIERTVGIVSKKSKRKKNNKTQPLDLFFKK